MRYAKLQIGHLCPDEILDLELDTAMWEMRNRSVNETVTSWNSAKSLGKHIQQHQGKKVATKSMEKQKSSQPASKSNRTLIHDSSQQQFESGQMDIASGQSDAFVSPRFPNEPISVPATDYSRPKIDTNTFTERNQSDVLLSNPLRKEPLHDPNLNPDFHSNSSDEVQAFAEKNFEDIDGFKVGSILFKDGK